MGYQNLHTHTTYCDGELSAEDMVNAALEKGGDSIGFSEHSYIPFDKDYSISPDDIPRYIGEINMLKEKYAGQIDIFLGLENDIYSTQPPEGLDYVIGAVHHIEHEGKHITIDSSLEEVLKKRDEYFGGDIYAVAERYFAGVAEIAEKTTVDIIGHFDLITKYNKGGRLFDETNPRYQKAALSAMDRVLESCKVFEVNTGAMYRCGNDSPYPSRFLLSELYKRGGQVVLSSDSHDAASLYYKFSEMTEFVKSCGFKYIKSLTKEGFIDERI